MTPFTEKRHRLFKTLATCIALALLGALSGLSAGFVHRNIKDRRSRATRLKSKLEFEAAKSKAAARPIRFRSLRYRRRGRGKGLAGSRLDELGVSHVSFGVKDVHGGVVLRPAQIRAVMEKYNEQIGRCLLRYKADRVTIRLTIMGSGLLARVETDLAGQADRCVRAAVRSARFPSFTGAKTQGQYHLRLR